MNFFLEIKYFHIFFYHFLYIHYNYYRYFLPDIYGLLLYIHILYFLHLILKIRNLLLIYLSHYHYKFDSLYIAQCKFLLRHIFSFLNLRLQIVSREYLHERKYYIHYISFLLFYIYFLL